MSEYAALEIRDKGEVLSRSQVLSIVRQFGGDECEIIYPTNIPALTHWWLLTQADGPRVIYFGTPETFTGWCGDNQVTGS